MAQLDYAEAKKVVLKGLLILGVVTMGEVFVALFGNGHIIHGFYLHKIVFYPVMIVLSLYKAYFIVYEFMHMRYEVKGLAMSVLLPTLLLVWAIIAFFQEGNSWHNRRELIKQKDQESVHSQPAPETGMLDDGRTYQIQ
ncbi:MAG: cytochrome C oxidase subunit IV family protein [Lewinellaceae bacterium]|nr:cytochrome C oxidase subunit IV family protein [Lewinellaceae bacterium]